MTDYDEEIRKGFELLSNGEYEESLEYFLKAMEIDAARPDAYSLASEALVEMGDIEKAKKHAEKAYNLDRERPEFALQYASIIMALGDMKQSLNMVNDVLKNHDMVEAHYIKSNIYENMGDEKKALIEAEAAYKMDKNPEYALNFCRIMEEAGKIEESMKILKEMVKADPQNLEAFYMLFRDSLAMNRIGDALNYIMECIAIDDQQPAFFSDLASLLDEMDDEKLAEKYYEKAVEISGDDVEPMLDLAEFYLDREYYDRAMEIIDLVKESIKSDEDIAQAINEKVNEVRRELNLLNGFNVLKYNTKRNASGWLVFKWYLDFNKLKELYETVHKTENAMNSVITSDCNDFFICENCYENNKAIIPFDKAVDLNFKCPECHRNLKRIDKENLINLISKLEIK